jgi:hypothetical protein
MSDGNFHRVPVAKSPLPLQTPPSRLLGDLTGSGTRNAVVIHKRSCGKPRRDVMIWWATRTNPRGREQTVGDPSVIVLVVLPDLTVDGDLPPGVHTATWPDFISRFGGSSPRRLWLAGRLRTVLELAATGGRLRRIFVWGSFLTAKPAPEMSTSC